MEYLTLPQTDLKVSKIALRCMRIADKSIEEVSVDRAVLKHSFCGKCKRIFG